jgi:hypothetical protein
VRRKDFDPENRIVHIRTSKNEMSKRVIPLNDAAFEVKTRSPRRDDLATVKLRAITEVRRDST